MSHASARRGSHCKAVGADIGAEFILHLQERETQQVPDADIFDKAISLLQWTTQELSSATVSKPKDGTFSLPSAFGSFHSDSLDAALRELESMQRSTSTERLHR